MKKIFALLAIVTLACSLQAQTGLTPINIPGNSSGEFTSALYPYDTVVKSTTYFLSAALIVDGKGFNNAVSYTFSVDSIAGTPDMALTTWASNDNIHWAPIASAATFNSAKNYWHFSSTVPLVSDSCINVATNPWTAKYIGFKIVVNSNTQRARYHIKAKAFKTY